MPAPSVIAIDSTTFLNESGLSRVIKSNTAGVIQVGDLLLGVIYSGSQVATMTTTGWTSIRTDGNGVGSVMLQRKIADAADVAASWFDFTWTPNGSASTMTSTLIVVRNFDPSNPIAVSNAATSSNTSNPSFATSVTPNTPDSLFILSVAGKEIATDISSPAMATNNPTWTLATGRTTTIGIDFTHHVWTAPRPETSATGNISVTGGSAASDYIAQVFVVNPIPQGGSKLTLLGVS